MPTNDQEERPEWQGREEAIEVLRDGGIAVIPTDTIYGISASAFDHEAVRRIYELKRRDARKPLIVLIADPIELESFGIILSEPLVRALATYWPGPTSIILSTIDDTIEYLERGNGEIAFRLPSDDALLSFLHETGPLVSTSVNLEGLPAAETASDAKAMFGGDIDAYVDAGPLHKKPSTVIRLFEDGDMEVVRE